MNLQGVRGESWTIGKKSIERNEGSNDNDPEVPLSESYLNWNRLSDTIKSADLRVNRRAPVRIVRDTTS